MIGRPFSRALALLIVSLSLLLFSGCTGAADRLWLKAPDWSRARLIGQTRDIGPVPLTIVGDRTFIFLVDGADEGYYPRLLALDPAGDILWERSYPEITGGRISDPAMAGDGADLRLFWISGETLYHATVETATGLLRDWPAPISGETLVGAVAVAQNPATGRIIVWYAGPRRQAGLYVYPTADFSVPAILVDPLATRPSIQFDDHGDLHVIWAHYPPGSGDNALYYAHYPGGAYGPDQQQRVIDPPIGPTTVFQGPDLGLDQGNVYILWTIEIRTGQEAGRVSSAFITFPHGQPLADQRPTELYVPSDYQPPYTDPPPAGLNAGRRVALGPGLSRTGQISDINANAAFASELVTVQRTALTYLMRKTENQVTAIYYRNGQPDSYQLLSFTPGNSTSPTILSDADDNLIITWLERSDTAGFLVYLAGTGPEMRQALAPLTSGDRQRLIASTLFGMVSGALLLPFALMWFIAPLAVVVLTGLLRGQRDELWNWRVLLSLGLTIASYWAGKLIFLPGLTDYVPFSAWIPTIQPGAFLPLQIGVPLIISLFALFVAWQATYRHQRNSPLLFTLLYVAIDSVLTTAIYGVIFFAAT